jgi:hypothetical protein
MRASRNTVLESGSRESGGETYYECRKKDIPAFGGRLRPYFHDGTWVCMLYF